MKSIFVLCPVLAFVTAAALTPQAAVPPEEASTYLTVQIENQPALDVPYVPTPAEVVERMLNIAGVNSSDILYDLGCGDGRVVVAAAKEKHVRRAIGVDMDPRRIEESNENARQAGVSERVRFQQKDLFEVDFKDATVMTLYLLPSVNLKLRPKLLHDLKPGARIVSHDFDMGDWKPDKQVLYKEHTIYFWVVPASVNGSWSWSLVDGERSHQYELRLGQRFQIVDQADLNVDGARQTVGNIHIDGDRLQFTTEGTVDGKKQLLLFQGSVKGNSVKGTITTAGKTRKNKTWKAERDPKTVSPIDITGEKVIQL